MSVTAAEAQKMIKENASNPNFKVIDVRTWAQRKISHIPNSEHVPLSDLDSRLNEFKKENTYLVYCKSGGRSQSAVNTLKKNGINAINLQGGMGSWNQETQSDCSIF